MRKLPKWAGFALIAVIRASKLPKWLAFILLVAVLFLQTAGPELIFEVIKNLTAR